MAKHSSISKVERQRQRDYENIGKQLRKHVGDDKSLRFKSTDRLLAEATEHFRVVGELSAVKGEGAVTARRKLREMREVKYFTDPEPTSKNAWDTKQTKAKPGQSRPVRGSTAKHQRIMKGQSARNSQGMGI
ncbi:hypothetical protein SoKa_gp1 [Pseudomonas phage SoKa]|uniref:Uncharacterized protein n=1 Tax=Pseudomonas phage SoKa TaxID=2930393 RepID=A0AAE9KF20_9CAUD|nr:hypothetical protein SoKa_gp1 [Pseudomonas phage SoKa]